MRRHGDGENNALETINAAATLIASGENRVAHVTSQKKTWGSCWSVYWCFGYHSHRKRIGHAVLSSDASSRNQAPAAENSVQAPSISLPFVAPPSSPASFLQSEPPSSAQSPAGTVSLTSISASMYSPTGPASIFAIGPYAHETQLVSPPVFSAFTTEPSTAPFTPPPESAHLTLPSSPEVPFARLLDTGFRNGEGGQKYPFNNYEFQCYQLHPGSPIGQLISPSSGISGSGASSPFPDAEVASNGPQFLEFRTSNPPKLVNLDEHSIREWRSHRGSGSLTPDSTGPASSCFPLYRQFSDVCSLSNSESRYRNNQVFGCQFSIDLTTEDALRCVEQKSQSPVNKTTAGRMASFNEPNEASTEPDGKTSDGTAETTYVEVPRHRKWQCISLVAARDFSSDNNDDDAPKPSWRANACASETRNGDISGGNPEATHVDAPRHQKQGSFALAPITDFSSDYDEDAPKPNWWANRHDTEIPDSENCTETPNTTAPDMSYHQKQQSVTLSPTRDFSIVNPDEEDAVPGPDWRASDGSFPAKDWSFFPTMQPGYIFR